MQPFSILYKFNTLLHFSSTIHCTTHCAIRCLIADKTNPSSFRFSLFSLLACFSSVVCVLVFFYLYAHTYVCIFPFDIFWMILHYAVEIYFWENGVLLEGKGYGGYGESLWFLSCYWRILIQPLVILDVDFIWLFLFYIYILLWFLKRMFENWNECYWYVEKFISPCFHFIM